MRPKSLVLLVLALGCGLIASIGINQVLAKRAAQAPAAAVETTPILVAVADIPMGEPLNETIMRVEEWPKEKVPRDALTSIEDTIGRVTRTRILQDEPIREGRLGAVKQPAEMVPVGYRVITVRVDASSGGAGLLLPGNRVDVLVYLRSNQQQGIGITGTRTILEDVKVFAVNDSFKLDEGDGEQKIPAKTVSLLVTPKQAEKVTLASELGKISLTMRSPGDDKAVNPQGTSVAEFSNSEKTDRQSQGGLSPDAPKREAADSGLTKWLKRGAGMLANAKPPEAQTEEEAEPERFTMVIIERDAARLVEFEDGKFLPVSDDEEKEDRIDPESADSAVPDGPLVPAGSGAGDVEIDRLEELLEGNDLNKLN